MSQASVLVFWLGENLYLSLCTISTVTGSCCSDSICNMLSLGCRVVSGGEVEVKWIAAKNFTFLLGSRLSD